MNPRKSREGRHPHHHRPPWQTQPSLGRMVTGLVIFLCRLRPFAMRKWFTNSKFTPDLSIFQISRSADGGATPPRAALIQAAARALAVPLPPLPKSPLRPEIRLPSPARGAAYGTGLADERGAILITKGSQPADSITSLTPCQYTMGRL